MIGSPDGRASGGEMGRRRFTLKLRLGVLIALVLVLGFAAFGGLAYWLFVRQQTLQMTDLISRELTRVQALFENPAVGAQLTEAGPDEVILQFVAEDGQVILPGASDSLPLATKPTIFELDGGEWLVGSTSWRSAAGVSLGTIRMALDLTGPIQVRRNLLYSLLASGMVIVVTTLFFGLFVLGRWLLPLTRMAAAARGLDPARPAPAPYRGPNDEVSDLAEALNALLDGIRHRQEMERANLAEIAHELASPLTLVAGHLEALVARGSKDSRLEAAHHAAKELLYTSQDLLTLSRGELERPLDLEIFDLGEVVRRVGQEYPGIGIDIVRPVEIAGNPQRVTQLVRNLVRNAVQASGDAVSVRLELRCSDTVQLVVRDCGPGIAPEDLPHIFDRFYTRRGGQGLGLSVAQRIARQHGGDIAVHSTPGQGAVFTVALPRLEAQLAEGPQ